MTRKVKIKRVPSMAEGGKVAQKNYSATDDPNVYLGKNGVKITRQEFNNANKNGFAWNSFEDYADYVGGWAHNGSDFNISPYYRTYGGNNISGADIALLHAQNDPAINQILQRNIARPGEVPMYSQDDSDAINKLIARNKQANPQQYLAYKAFGGQLGFGLDLGISKSIFGTGDDQDINIRKTLAPVDRKIANVEAEKGETVVGDFDKDGQNEHFTIGGNRHSQGGTPLNLPDGSFIFSDTKKMQMGGQELTAFGKSADSNKKYTPAQLAKQYDVNKYKAILDDKNADPMEKRTAQMMMDNYQNKLSQLALVQEAKKGFPQGIPEMAQTYLDRINQGTQPTIGGTIDQVAPQSQFAFGGQLPRFDGGGDTPDPIDPYQGGKTPEGRYTPTKKDNKYNRGNDYLDNWESVIPGISNMSNAAAQQAIYDHMLRHNPEVVKKMWMDYGLNRKGLQNKSLAALTNNGKFDESTLTPDNMAKLKTAYADGMFGVRQMDPVFNRPGPLEIPQRQTGPIIPQTLTPQELHVTPLNPMAHPGDFNPYRQNTPYDYMTPDKWTVMQGINNRAALKKYLPWEAPVAAVTPTPTFYDPNRELASNAEQMNTQMMYNNQFSGPQSIAARNSQVAGQAAQNAANIMSRYDSQNVQTSNQFAGIDADIMNRLQEAKTRGIENLYTGNVIANQQYDNSKMKLDNDLLRAQENAWNNRTMLGMINDTNPYYFTDPVTGRIVFKGGKDYNGTSQGATQQKTYQDFYNEGIAQGMDDQYAKKHAYEMTKGQRVTYTDRNMDGIPDSARYVAQYMGMMGRMGMMGGNGYGSPYGY
jgi:hypothetical protein